MVVITSDNRVIRITESIQLSGADAKLLKPSAIEREVPEITVLLDIHHRISPQRRLECARWYLHRTRLKPESTSKPHEARCVSEPSQIES